MLYRSSMQRSLCTPPRKPISNPGYTSFAAFLYWVHVTAASLGDFSTPLLLHRTTSNNLFLTCLREGAAVACFGVCLPCARLRCGCGSPSMSGTIQLVPAYDHELSALFRLGTPMQLGHGLTMCGSTLNLGPSSCVDSSSARPSCTPLSPARRRTRWPWASQHEVANLTLAS